MSKVKPVTPYQRLKEAASLYLKRCLFPRRKGMWMYARNRLDEGWALRDVYERVRAADQLGWDVALEARDDGLHVIYKERPGERPWELRDV